MPFPLLYDEHTASTLPDAASMQDQLIYRTDLKGFYYSNGTTWVDLGYGTLEENTSWLATGDLLVGEAAGMATILPISETDGQVLTVVDGTAAWADPTAGTGDVATDTIWTSPGLVVFGNASSDGASTLSMALATPGQVLTVNGAATAPIWDDPPSGITTATEWTNKGDLMVGTGSSPTTAARLGIGAHTGDLLAVSATGTPEWIEQSALSTAASTADASYDSRALFEAAAGADPGELTTGRFYRFPSEAGWLGYATAIDDYQYLSAPGEPTHWGEGTWADRPNSVDNPAIAAGDTYVVTDLGNVGRVHVYFDGTYWRPVNGKARIWTLGAEIACASGTTETYIDTVTIPIKLIPDINSGLRFSASLETGATTESLTLSFRMGGTDESSSFTMPVLASPSMGTVGTNLNLGYEAEARWRSATTIRRLGKGAATRDDPMAGFGAAAMVAAITVANMTTTENYLILTYTRAANVSTATINMIDIWWIA